MPYGRTFKESLPYKEIKKVTPFSCVTNEARTFRTRCYNLGIIWFSQAIMLVDNYIVHLIQKDSTGMK